MIATGGFDRGSIAILAERDGDGDQDHDERTDQRQHGLASSAQHEEPGHTGGGERVPGALRQQRHPVVATFEERVVARLLHRFPEPRDPRPPCGDDGRYPVELSLEEDAAHNEIFLVLKVDKYEDYVVFDIGTAFVDYDG